MADFATSLEVINSAVQLRVAIFESVGLFRWPMDDPNESDQSFFQRSSRRHLRCHILR
jgi:hypothetical protein